MDPYGRLDEMHRANHLTLAVKIEALHRGRCIYDSGTETMYAIR